MNTNALQCLEPLTNVMATRPLADHNAIYRPSHLKARVASRDTRLLSDPESNLIDWEVIYGERGASVLKLLTGQGILDDSYNYNLKNQHLIDQIRGYLNTGFSKFLLLGLTSVAIRNELQESLDGKLEQ